MHYQSLQRPDEGLIHLIRFGGEAYTDNPNPPLHELFYAATVTSVTIYSYGKRWHGKPAKTPPEATENLDLKCASVSQIEAEDLCRQLGELLSEAQPEPPE